MKLNLRISLTLVIALGLVGISIIASKGTTTMVAVDRANSANKAPVTIEQQPVDELEMIDGAKNPEKISDQVAYSLFFRVICCRHDDEEKRQGRAYLRRLGLDEMEIETLIAAGEEFDQRVGVLDIQAAEIQMRYHPDHLIVPTPDERKQLKQLQKQKERITDEMVASLPTRLGAEGYAKVRQFVRETMKRKVKMSKPKSA